MTASIGAHCRYRIILRGECQHLLAGILDNAIIESSRGLTSVTASLRDDSELYGLLEKLQEFALHIVSLDELGPDALRARPAAGAER
jgi:hypothetical protein